jgi:hypothetical protein
MQLTQTWLGRIVMKRRDPIEGEDIESGAPVKSESWRSRQYSRKSIRANTDKRTSNPENRRTGPPHALPNANPDGMTTQNGEADQ